MVLTIGHLVLAVILIGAGAIVLSFVFHSLLVYFNLGLSEIVFSLIEVVLVLASISLLIWILFWSPYNLERL